MRQLSVNTGVKRDSRVVALLVLAFGILLTALFIALLPRQESSTPGAAIDSVPIDSLPPQVAAAGTTLVFELEADTYVSAEQPGSNFSDSSELRVDGSPELVAYLGFRVEGATAEGSVDATLRLFANSSSRDGGLVHSVAGQDLDELNLVADNAPAPGEMLGFHGSLVEGTWLEVELEDLQLDTYIILALTTESETARSFASRETGGNAPQLVFREPSEEEAVEAELEPLTDEEVVLLAVGDIGDCVSTGDEEVAALVSGLAGELALLGDISQDEGTPEQYRECYDPAWGQFLDRSRPAAGNHDYLTEGASGYYAYFGESAGDPDKGYFSYNLGAWHIVVLNSNCSQIAGCSVSSPQGRWLQEDLSENQAECTLAYAHHPRFSSGQHGNFDSMQDLWQILYGFGAELYLSGHDHGYERFAPQDPSGAAVSDGIRQFVVGTGGKGLRPLGPRIANSEVSQDQDFGVLQLDLRPGGYAWQFIPIPGSTFTDAGEESCH
ncbi:MAG: DNRLRE domain-containing protein [Dehalococcoidia bacterium]|nr:DNRLRE domain-containing protein [Dehalococcoidia bacterium]